MPDDKPKSVNLTAAA